CATGQRVPSFPVLFIRPDYLFRRASPHSECIYRRRRAISMPNAGRWRAVARADRIDGRLAHAAPGPDEARAGHSAPPARRDAAPSRIRRRPTTALHVFPNFTATADGAILAPQLRAGDGR